MEVAKFSSLMEQIAPRSLAEPWDNPGLLIEPEFDRVERILVALDCTPEVAKEAAALQVDLVLTHHPLFFKPVSRFYHSHPDTAAAYWLVRHGIGLFACHTNLDTAVGGVNDALAAVLGLQQVDFFGELHMQYSNEHPGMGRIGFLPAPMPLKQFVMLVESRLHASVQYHGDDARLIQRVALLGGSGGDFAAEAKAAGADVFVTGEVKHSQAIASAILDLPVLSAGHYETESPVLQPMINSLLSAAERLQCKLQIFTSKAEHAPFKTVRTD